MAARYWVACWVYGREGEIERKNVDLCDLGYTEQQISVMPGFRAKDIIDEYARQKAEQKLQCWSERATESEGE